jgi:hypothetical protein
MAAKKNSTYSIDEDIRKNFKMECLNNEVDMSDTIEFMMANYITVSQSLREEAKANVYGE